MFGSKVVNRQLFHRKTVFHIKILSIINFTIKLLSIKDYILFKWTLIERLLRSLLRSLIVKLLLDNIFIERLCLRKILCYFGLFGYYSAISRICYFILYVQDFYYFAVNCCFRQIFSNTVAMIRCDSIFAGSFGEINLRHTRLCHYYCNHKRINL